MKERKIMGQPWAGDTNCLDPQRDLAGKYKSDTLQVVAIGDSITYGYPYTQRESWVQLASLRLGIPMVNKGEPGEITAEMHSRFYQDVIALGPSHVIITGGTNDAFFNVPASSLRNNIYKMSEMAVAAEVIPIIGIPIPVNDRLAEERLSSYREWMREFAFGQGYQIIDFYAALVDESSGFMRAEYHDDGLHPNRRGYQAMSEVVYIK